MILLLLLTLTGSSKQIEKRLAIFLSKTRTQKAVGREEGASAAVLLQSGLRLVLPTRLVVIDVNRINIGLP